MMLNRRHIRIKVMQTLYAYKGNEGDDMTKDMKFLLFSINNMYNLYLLLMALIIAVQNRVEADLQKRKKKHLATYEDKNPNKKFIKNSLLLKIKNNTKLNNILKQQKITHWELDNEYVDIIFKAITTSDLYSSYMQTKTYSFKEDKDFVISMFKDVIAPNDKLYEYVEDKNLTWLNDFPTVNTTILKLLRKVRLTSPETHFVPNLYKDDDDKQFVKDLFTKTLLNKSSLVKVIERKTKNWESDRITNIDHILLQMAICELQNFPSIPVKVTMNEYLEIAKEYSTPKSSTFINGILDKLVKEYNASGTIQKTGRGLL